VNYSGVYGKMYLMAAGCERFQLGGGSVNRPSEGWFKLLIAVGVLSVIMTMAMIRSVTNFLNEIDRTVDDLVINDVDISKIPDGTYTGTHDFKIVAADVSVEVRDGRIVSIDILRHTTSRGSLGEAVVDAVLEKQSLDVDAVTGATASSKAILKAIENALTIGTSVTGQENQG